MPGAYSGATYAVLPTTTTNATHWQLDVLCTGCSQWEGGSLNPNGVNNLAWAKNTRAVNTASSNTSSFGIHDGRGVFSHDLSAAKIPKGVFDAVVYGLSNPSSTPSSSAAPVVSTAVTTVPKPVTPSSSSIVSTRLTQLPSSSGPGVVTTRVTTRVTELPKPTSSTPPVVVITTRVTKPLPTTVPTGGVTSQPTKVTTPSILTITVTARPPATTQDNEWPPWTGGGGPPWGKGKGGGPPWGRGGRWPRRERLAAPPQE